VVQLHGEYECKLDSKNRLIIPAALKKQLPLEGKEGFFINRGFEKCCILYPKLEWEKIAAEVNQLSDYIEKERKFKRYFLRGASMLEMDAANRVLLPKPMQDHSGIEPGSELILLCIGNKVELWEKSEYNKMLNDEPEDFGAMAQEVMGRRGKEADRAE